MKLKKSDVNILLVFIGIALAACSFFFIFKPFNKKTDDLKVENQTLQQEVNRLTDLSNNKQQYLDETEAFNAEMEEIKEQFAADYRPEDEVLYVDTLEKSFEATGKKISMLGKTAMDIPTAAPAADPAAVPTDDTTADPTAEPAADPAAAPTDGTVVEDTTAPVTAQNVLYRNQVNLEFDASYNAVKDIIKKMNDDNMKKSIDGLTLAFDSETGDLTGTLVFNMYSMTGTDAVYTTPSVPSVSFGSDNIFKSATKKTAIQANKASEEQAAEQKEAETQKEVEDRKKK